MNPEYWRPELFEISLDQPQDGPNACKPQGVVCDGLKITVGEKAQIDINRLFGKLGITTSSINLDSLGDTTWCSALDSSSHRCATNKSITLPEQLGVTPDRIVDAINNGNEIVYYPDPQTYYIPETVAPIVVQAPLATPEATSTPSAVATEQSSANQPNAEPTPMSQVDAKAVNGVIGGGILFVAVLSLGLFFRSKSKKRIETSTPTYIPQPSVSTVVAQDGPGLHGTVTEMAGQVEDAKNTLRQKERFISLTKAASSKPAPVGNSGYDPKNDVPGTKANIVTSKLSTQGAINAALLTGQTELASRLMKNAGLEPQSDPNKKFINVSFPGDIPKG